MIGETADPVLLDRIGFVGAEVGEDFVQNAHQYFLIAWHAHSQLLAVGCFAADV